MLVRYMDTDYAYLHNLQGDIVGIVDMSGATVVEYGYDAWGTPVSTEGSMAETLGYDNPFRYRRYVWDGETGLYYLRSRYYDPGWGRFVNADALLGKVGVVLGHSIFTYCKSSPIAFIDSSGYAERKAWYAGIVEWFVNLIPSYSSKFKSPHYGEDEKTLALNHPVAAFKGDLYKDAASSATNSIFGNGAADMEGTIANAFKHAYWNALMAYDLGPSSAEKFANAHESVYNSQLDNKYLGITIGAHCEMDYYYNALGRSVGQQRFP